MIINKSIKSIRTELLQIAKKLYGIDLSSYSENFLNRRLELIALRNGIKNTVDFKNLIVNNPSFAKELEMNISVNVTEMFRDPGFFKSLIAILKKEYSPGEELRIWHPACSEGHEVNSLAILLNEVDLLKNAMIYGTDISHTALNNAKLGILKANQLKNSSQSYRTAGGNASLSDYFTLSYEKAIFNKQYRAHTCFSYHQLGVDPPIRNFQLVLCRNLFIYFDENRQTILLNSLLKGLKKGGILCMGLYEPIDHLKGKDNLKCIDPVFKIYRKMGD